MTRLRPDQIKDLFLAAHPVGSIYMSVNSTNPSTAYGGTWVAWGSGRVPVGVNASDNNFNTVEKTGGASTHTLTQAQLPKISGEFRIAALSKSNMMIEHYSGVFSADKSGAALCNNWTASGSSSGNNDTCKLNIGSGGSHNNLQPYITCYMWKRTA